MVQNLAQTWPRLTPNKKGPSSIIAETLCCIVWAHQGMILGPPDYESGALTNWAIGPENLVAQIIMRGKCKIFTLNRGHQS